MEKRQLIEDIRELNPTAQATFLGQFEEPELQQYLEHLREAQAKHIRVNACVAEVTEQRKVS